ncbi:hypothetical protein L195_g039670 [Trifolium pratense]|uniref:Uncharacterized protein n=1 Tax=Trifolium pratense TaxID=57577 RepID=A0A2K3LYM2_TRIPR|nr:hypothetical protein L195_g039670 [Trifolium pratense]
MALCTTRFQICNAEYEPFSTRLGSGHLVPTVCSGLVFGSKGSFMPVVFCHRGFWYVNLSMLTVSSFVVSYLN